MPKLIIGAGTPQAQEFDLHEGENFLGSDATNHFQLEDVSVSGSHAQIVVTGNSAVVTDLGSTNGTFIDREPISESVIQSGQILRLGGVELLYKEDTVAKTDLVLEQIASVSSQGLRIAGGGTIATSPILLPLLWRDRFLRRWHNRNRMVMPRVKFTANLSLGGLARAAEIVFAMCA